ncbi:DUF3037 domain-containing protein [Phaeacidiphilus oryzae]|uniref:DUF3037 domain-containing protein n=1 Tax=Phaeacidiphilus oryzae TaxID=348818 RepID=UPI0005639679|nr:DUF3037 domain-containing protein [Phaeacidiphilus oryzae]
MSATSGCEENVERRVFEYAVLRAVPRAEREEQINVGVLVYCHTASWVRALTHLDADRLRALDPQADADGVRRALRAIEGICAGGAAAGQAAKESAGQRFRWLTAPRSTVVRAGPVHSGLTSDHEAEAERLFALLVR